MPRRRWGRREVSCSDCRAAQGTFGVDGNILNVDLSVAMQMHLQFTICKLYPNKVPFRSKENKAPKGSVCRAVHEVSGVSSE